MYWADVIGRPGIYRDNFSWNSEVYTYFYPAICSDGFEQEMYRLFGATKCNQLSTPEVAIFKVWNSKVHV